MSDRIHAWLDGEIPLEALTPDERSRAGRLRAVLDAASAPVRAARAPDGFTARVMAAVPHEPPRNTPWRAALAWLWNPTPVRLVFRPAYALAGAGLAALAAVAVLPEDDAGVADSGTTVVVSREAQAPPVYVQFRLEAQGASSVRLAGSFTGWQPRVPLRESAPGEWTALVPLEPGVHDYAFVIDGERWVADPHAPQVDDDFGGTNSRISLPPLSRQL
jgi:Glycogen recognition site of AMP-activated protein kinase